MYYSWHSHRKTRLSQYCNFNEPLSSMTKQTISYIRLLELLPVWETQVYVNILHIQELSCLKQLYPAISFPYYRLQTAHHFPFAKHLFPHTTGRNTRSIIFLGQTRCCWFAEGEAGQQIPFGWHWDGHEAGLCCLPSAAPPLWGTGSRNHRHTQEAPRIPPLHGAMRGTEPGGPAPGLCLAAAVPGSVERAVCLQPRSAGCPSPRKDPKTLLSCLHVAPARRSPARWCQAAPRGSAMQTARLIPHKAWDPGAAPGDRAAVPPRRTLRSP